MIENGNLVSVHYSGRLTEGEQFDSSEGREPLQFTVGSGQIIRGFDSALLGKSVGDKFTVNISPDDAYGQIREDLFVKVLPTQMPGEVEVGQVLQANSENGSTMNVVVSEVTDEYVLIDGNHPLAGKELIFDIEVVSVQ